jgi:hypothetical protein
MALCLYESTCQSLSQEVSAPQQQAPLVADPAFFFELKLLNRKLVGRKTKVFLYRPFAMAVYARRYVNQAVSVVMHESGREAFVLLWRVEGVTM